jgi:hypothetical protein
VTPLHTAATRIASGTATLADRLGRRATAWVRAGRRDDLTGWQATLGCLLRAGLLLAGLWLLWRAVRAVPALMLLLVPAALLAAWRAGQAPKTEPAPTGATPDPGWETDDEAWPPDEFLPLLRAAFGTDRQAHLTVLAERLTTATAEAWSPAAVRAACEAAGVPVERGVRMPGRSPSTGVRLKTLPEPLPGPPVDPVAGVVVAGQNTATDPATATATGRELLTVGDVAMELHDDPTNPVRTHVRVLKRTA